MRGRRGSGDGRRSPVGRIVSLIVAGVLSISVVTAIDVVDSSAPAAQAADASQFDPGFIIADSVFYDSSSMNANDVQSFLNARVPRCTSGYVCLKDYVTGVPTLSGDRYCGGYGGGYQTAAQVIDGVARACGINQRVLLVLLQKEQGLVTSTAPTDYMYSAATGANCPDSAPCSPATAGFFKQVYAAARLYRYYQGNPNSYNFKAFTWNNILYSPYCPDRKSVYIANQATAGLYIYTPYTPDSAAMANLYGSGGSCSSYGNRNFWRLFTDWFGDPRRFEVLAGFADYWNARGGAGGFIGNPLSYGVYVDQNGKGWYQRFRGGAIYGSTSGGTVFVPAGPLLSAYDGWGGASGGLGWPNAETVCSGTSCSQSLTGGSLASTAAWGGHAILGGMDPFWRSTGGLGGTLGAAVSDMVMTSPANGVGWTQNFERGVVALSDSGTLVLPYGDRLAYWFNSGGAGGFLGWPTGDAVCVGSGCAQPFQNAQLTSSPTWGVHPVYGGFRTYWTDSGAMNGLGAAFNDISYSVANGGGWMQNYNLGIVAQSRSSSTVLVRYGAIQRIWDQAGTQNGWLGFPLAEQSCSGEFCAQHFQGGVISTSTTWGNHIMVGGLGGYWADNGGFAKFGAAVNDVSALGVNGGGWMQNLSQGVMTQSTTAAPIFTPYGPILGAWYGYGGPATWLGWPTSPQTCTAGACTQTFQHGIARSSAAGAVSFSAS